MMSRSPGGRQGYVACTYRFFGDRQLLIILRSADDSLKEVQEFPEDFDGVVRRDAIFLRIAHLY